MIIYGKNVINEIIKNAPYRIKDVYIYKNLKDKNYFFKILKSKNIRFKILEKQEIEKISNTKKNQGIVADIEDKNIIKNLDEYLKNKEKEKKVKLIILDNVVDPHNVGAIIRTCEIFGVYGIIISTHNSAPISGVTYKTSSGAIEYVDIIEVNNINNAILKLKRYGYWIYGFSLDGKNYLDEIKFENKSVFVFGSEGKGLRRLVKKNSDFLVKIRQTGKINSLNISNAVAVVLYKNMIDSELA